MNFGKSGSKVPGRRNDIDWLRVLAMLSVFLFHCARFFDYEDWHVKNPELSLGFSVFVGILAQWIMPIFFVLSGESTRMALGFRSANRYIRERFKRLFIPLVFGIFVLIPPQVYIERVSHGQFEGSFFRFYPHYFDGFYAFGGNFAWMGLHLWFLLVLFIFSIIMLPLFLWLWREIPYRGIQRLALFFEKPGTILFLVLPLAVMDFSFHPEGVGTRAMGGWNVFVYLMFFLYGYLLASEERFKRAVEGQRWIMFILAFITTLIGFFLVRSGYDPSFGSLNHKLISIFRTFNSWVWVLTLLGWGSKHLFVRNRLLKYTGEAVLPFYILHQSVIVGIGFFIASWKADVFMKYLALSTSSFVSILLIYELVVRRLGFFRFLFGMKRSK